MEKAKGSNATICSQDKSIILKNAVSVEKICKQVVHTELFLCSVDNFIFCVKLVSDSNQGDPGSKVAGCRPLCIAGIIF